MLKLRHTAMEVLTMCNDVLSNIASRNGFTIHDVPADGNCLFSAIAYQLALGYLILMHLVSHLENHPHINGMHIMLTQRHLLLRMRSCQQ